MQKYVMVKLVMTRESLSKITRKQEDKKVKDRKETNIAAKAVTAVLNKFLKLEANSTSCIVVHQPKMPADLKKFRK